MPLRYVGSLFMLILSVASGCSHPKWDKIDAKQLEGATPWTNLDVQDSPDDFTFVIVSDNTNMGRPDVFETAMGKVNLLRPAFVMCVGDLIQGYTDSKEQVLKEWDEIQEIIKKIDAPFFYTAGNHDFWNKMAAEEWKNHFGPSYYHFRYKNVLFMLLNSEIIQSFLNPESGVGGAEGTERHMDWIKKVLNENADARWTFLFLHQPFWDYEEIPRQWIQVEEMLGDRPHTVFAGHNHSYTSEKRNGRYYISLATTGGSSKLRGIDYGEFDHVTLVNMTGKGPIIANLLLDGIYDQNIRTKELRELVGSLGKALIIEPEVDQNQIFTKGVTNIKIVNSIDRDLSVKAKFVGSESVIIERDSVSIKVGAKETAVIGLPMKATQSSFYGALDPVYATFDLSINKPDGHIFEEEYKYAIYPETLYRCESPEKSVKIDGDLTEWGDLPYKSWLDRSSDKEKKGMPPLQFIVAQDSAFLYIAGKVRDDELFFSKELSHLEQDGMAINLDARSDPKRSDNESLLSTLVSGESKKLLNVSIGLLQEKMDPEQVKYFPGFPEGTLIGRTPIRGGYAIEIAIPVTYLDEIQGMPWRAVRLNIGVRDKDPSKGPGVTVKWWRPDRFSKSAIPASGTFVRDTGIP